VKSSAANHAQEMNIHERSLRIFCCLTTPVASHAQDDDIHERFATTAPPILGKGRNLNAAVTAAKGR